MCILKLKPDFKQITDALERKVTRCGLDVILEQICVTPFLEIETDCQHVDQHI